MARSSCHSELRKVIEAWPKLSPELRTAVLAMKQAVMSWQLAQIRDRKAKGEMQVSLRFKLSKG